MSTKFTIGFSNKRDLSDFNGVHVHYDGYPDAVLPNFLWMSKTGRFSDLVKAIKNTKTSVRSMNSFDQILYGEPIFDPFPDGSRVEGRDDFFSADYSYAIQDSNTITYYENTDDPGRTIKVNNIVDWEIVYRKVFEKLFNLQSHEMGNSLYMALYKIEAMKSLK